MPRKNDNVPFMTRRKAENEEKVENPIIIEEVQENEPKEDKSSELESKNEKVEVSIKKEETPKEEPKKDKKESASPKKPSAKKTKKNVQSKKRADTTKSKAKKTSAEDLLNTPFMEEILEAKEKLNVLWGDISGVYVDNDTNKVIMSVIYKDEIEVIITEDFLFEDDVIFSRNYARLDEEAKLEKRLAYARHSAGSKTPFIVGKVHKNMEGEYVVLGSRVDAMKKLREIYFLHEETKSPVDVNVNDEVEALVLYVGEDVVHILCCGVEYRLDRHNTSNLKAVEDCRTMFTSGETIKVRVKKINITKDKKVLLKLSAVLLLSDEERKKRLSKLVVHGSYIGFVRNAKTTSNGTTYTVILQNKKFEGINVAVRDFNIIDNVPLNKNDRVVVQIISVNMEYGYANAKAVKV